MLLYMDNKKFSITTFPVMISQLFWLITSSCRSLQMHYRNKGFILWLLEPAIPTHKKEGLFSHHFFTRIEKSSYYCCGIYSIWVPASHYLLLIISAGWWSSLHLLLKRSFLRGTAMQYHSHIEGKILAVPLDCTSFFYFPDLLIRFPCLSWIDFIITEVEWFVNTFLKNM